MISIICRVAAEFHDPVTRQLIYVVPASKRNKVCDDVPDAAQKDPLFNQLIAEGSMEAVVSLAQRKRVEDDPMKGHEASGKTIAAEGDGEGTGEAKGKPGRKPKAEKEDAAETATDAK